MPAGQRRINVGSAIPPGESSGGTGANNFIFYADRPAMPDGFGAGGCFRFLDGKDLTMARKPNYKFERMERDRAKAAKKAARAEAKAQKAEARKAGEQETPTTEE